METMIINGHQQQYLPPEASSARKGTCPRKKSSPKNIKHEHTGYMNSHHRYIENCLWADRRAQRPESSSFGSRFGGLQEQALPSKIREPTTSINNNNTSIQVDIHKPFCRHWSQKTCAPFLKNRFSQNWPFNCVIFLHSGFKKSSSLIFCLCIKQINHWL